MKIAVPIQVGSFLILGFFAGCSTSDQAQALHPDSAATGGAAGTATGGSGFGGATGTGGSISTGGMNGTGGRSGTMATGGAGQTGGSRATGGATSDGGRAGGTSGLGGASGSGGDPSKGGASSLGGATNLGGTSGASGTGGSPDAGIAKQDTAGPETKRDTETQETRLPIQDGATSDSPTSTSPVTVYIAGDSTVSTYTNSSIHQAGWGQYLQNYFTSDAKIVNKAVGGMTSRHFIEAGYLDQIVAVLKAGDYLLVQFGTNDGNKTATYTLSGSTTEIPYYLDPETDFKTYLTKYVDATSAKNATTIFVTPPPRHSCNSGETGVRNGLSAYAAAMNELGPTLHTPVVDLNAMTIAYLANVSCDTSGSTFYLVKADGTTDSTHFQETGANIMAGLVAKGTTGVSTLGLPLSVFVK